eukprot:678062-Alexandrium_andersonii.AAC.1
MFCASRSAISETVPHQASAGWLSKHALKASLNSARLPSSACCHAPSWPLLCQLAALASRKEAPT